MYGHMYTLIQDRAKIMIVDSALQFQRDLIPSLSSAHTISHTYSLHIPLCVCMYVFVSRERVLKLSTIKRSTIYVMRRSALNNLN